MSLIQIIFLIKTIFFCHPPSLGRRGGGSGSARTLASAPPRCSSSRPGRVGRSGPRPRGRRAEGEGRRAEGRLRQGPRPCSLPAASPSGRPAAPQRLHSRAVPQVAVGPSSVGGLVQNTFLDGVKGHIGARGQARVRGRGARDSGMLGPQTHRDAGSCSAVALPDLALWVQKFFF